MHVFFFSKPDKSLKHKLLFKCMHVNVEFKLLVTKIFLKLINNCFVALLKSNESI